MIVKGAGRGVRMVRKETKRLKCGGLPCTRKLKLAAVSMLSESED